MDAPKLEELNSASIRKCAMQNKYPDFCKMLDETYPAYSWPEKLYLYYNGLSEPSKCVVCGGDVRFINTKMGYRRTCCYKCQGRDPLVQARKRDTTLKNYGVENPGQSNIVRERMKETVLKNYGVENPFSSDKIKQKIRRTNCERYGVDYPMQSKTIREKSIQTFIRKYGVEWNSKLQEVKDQVRKTCEERYGGIGYASDELNNKCRETCRVNHSWSNASKISQKFFSELDNYFSEYITHYADKNGEKSIKCPNKTYRLDYFIEDLNIDIEFNGDAIHGNPLLFEADEHCMPFNRTLTAEDLWMADEIRRIELEKMGIKTIVVWESEYTKDFDFKAFVDKILNPE